MTDRVDEAIAAVWRIESPKLIARLSRMTRDVGKAEDLAQDAFVAALSQWPDEGIPRNPGAWLMTTAKRRAVDAIRRDETLARKSQELARAVAVAESNTDVAAAYEEIDDDLLRLMFVACHPGPHHRGDRPRVSHGGSDDRAAHRAREADACGGARSV